jgi:hypothetical protein
MAALTTDKDRLITANITYRSFFDPGPVNGGLSHSDIYHRPITPNNAQVNDQEKKEGKQKNLEKGEDDKGENMNTKRQGSGWDSTIRKPRPRLDPVPQLEPCLITRIPSVGNEKAHWINAVRHTQRKDVKLGVVRSFHFCRLHEIRAYYITNSRKIAFVNYVWFTMTLI